MISERIFEQPHWHWEEVVCLLCVPLDYVVRGKNANPPPAVLIGCMMGAPAQVRSEKSYDSLPNFSAGDCLNCLGIGRNQYIEIINQSKSKGSFFNRSRKDPRQLLPDKPVRI